MIKKLGAIFFFALAAFLAYKFAIRYYVGEAREEAADFPSYYYGAKLAFDFDTTPYSRATWNIVEKEYKLGKLFPFLYPPPSLLFFRLFNLFAYETAKLLMLGLNHALAVVFLLLFFLGVLKQEAYEPLPMVGAIYLYNFFPLVLTIYTGQINMLILVLICLAWLAIKENQHPVLIALPLALGIILKLYPALFLIILLFRKEYGTIVYTIAIVLVVSILSAPFLPVDVWRSWYENVMVNGYLAQNVLGLAIAKPANQSINAFLIRMFFGLNVRFDALLRLPDFVVQFFPYILSGFVGLASLGATWRLNKRSENENLDLQFGLWLLVMFLIAPISWDHHLVLILPAVYIAFLEAFKRKWHWSLPILTGLAYFLATNFDFNNPTFREGWRTLLISSKLYAIALLWALYILLSLIPKRETGTKESN